MTWKQMIYIVNDMCKLYSDDTVLNENHIRFLLSLYRAMILKTNYSSIKRDIPDSDYQTICVSMKPESSGICGSGDVYVSTESVPSFMETGSKNIFPDNGYGIGNMIYVSQNRFQYTNINPYLRNVIYATIGSDRKLRLKSSSDMMKYIDKIKIRGIFQDAEKAASMACPDSVDEGTDVQCSPDDTEFPLEDAFAPMLINYVLKDVLGAAYRPSDKINDATDELYDIAKMAANYAKKDYNDRIRGNE